MLINRDIFEEYLEQFHQPPKGKEMIETLTCPQTGDASNMTLWGSLAAASLGALGFSVAMRKGER